MAQEGGSGDQSLPAGASGTDWHGPNGGQHKTLLGAHPQGLVPPERKWPHHPCHLLPGQAACPHPQPGCMGPNGVANHGGYTTCPYRGRVVWLLPGPGGRSQPHDAGGTILGYRRRGSLPVHCKSPGVQGEYLGIQPHHE